MTNEPFGAQIRRIRDKLGYTQQHTADVLKVDKQTVSNWECMRVAPWPKQRGDILQTLLALLLPLVEQQPEQVVREPNPPAVPQPSVNTFVLPPRLPKQRARVLDRILGS